MIWCIAGLLGGGKSFYAVERMARHIASGGICYSNIRLELDPWYNVSYKLPTWMDPVLYPGALRVVDESGKGDYYNTGNGYVYNSRGFRYYLRKKYNWDLQPGQYTYLEDELVGPQLVEHISGGSTDLPVMVVLDEALDHFESGTSTADAGFRSFLRHVRKLGIDLYFIAQDFGSLDRRIRALCHYAVNCRDLHTWKVPVLGCTLPPPWRYTIQVLEWHANEFGKINSPPVNPDKFHFRDPLIFGSYSSTGLHRAFPLKKVQSDFRGLGKIQTKDIPMWCKILSLVDTLLLVVLFFLRPSSTPVVSEFPEAIVQRLDALEAGSISAVVPGASVQTQSTARVVACMSNWDTGGYDVWYSDNSRKWSPVPLDVQTIDFSQPSTP